MFLAYLDGLEESGVFERVYDVNFFTQKTSGLILPKLEFDMSSKRWKTRIPAECFKKTYEREAGTPTGSLKPSYPIWIGSNKL